MWSDWRPRSHVLRKGKQTTRSHCTRDGETLMGTRGRGSEGKECGNTTRGKNKEGRRNIRGKLLLRGKKNINEGKRNIEENYCRGEKKVKNIKE